ncbi:MAG: (2Fe-2S) ferredoxin domain-containing protein [Elusimicrobia bacterium]|nr:(2Fe-2S) ferredoxin domain-containing protein [Elusimicrobiota bacterium]
MTNDKLPITPKEDFLITNSKLSSRRPPYQCAVLVCTNKRDQGRVSCAGESRPGEEICRELKEKVKSSGLAQKIRVIRSGCLDMCDEGPTVLVYPNGNVFTGVGLGDIETIIEFLRKQISRQNQ